MTRLTVIMAAAILSLPNQVALCEPTSKPALEPPIIYFGRFFSGLNPMPRLTDDQIREVRDQARAACPPRQRIWFIWIKANSIFEGRRDTNGTAFFTPTERKHGLWKGQSVFVGKNSSVELIQQQIRESMKKSGKGDFEPPKWTPPPLSDYWFVTPSEEKWNGDELPMPSSAEFPFAPPQGVTDAQTVQIVKYLRENVDSIAAASSSGFGLMKPAHADARDRLGPVQEIRMDGSDFEVRTGSQEGILSGAGLSIHLRKTDKSFEVFRVDFWVS